MEERKQLGKKIRFEVFKRDSFTCQYCGKMAPDIILEVDHIIPVTEGGKNEILNLVTSCFDCNRGKGKTKLSDSTVIKKQQSQLINMNEKIEQLKMIIEWKSEMKDIKEMQIDQINALFEDGVYRYLSDFQRKRVSIMIREFGFEEVYEVTEIAIDQYGGRNGIEGMLKKMGGICYNRREGIKYGNKKSC